MLVTVPFRARLTHTALLAVIPEIGSHPPTLAEAIPEAVEVVLVTVAQGAAEELELEALALFARFLSLTATSLLPAVLPLLERIYVLPDGRPGRVVIQENVYHQFYIQLLDIRLLEEPGCEAGVGTAGFREHGGRTEKLC